MSCCAKVIEGFRTFHCTAPLLSCLVRSRQMLTLPLIAASLLGGSVTRRGAVGRLPVSMMISSNAPFVDSLDRKAADTPDRPVLLYLPGIEGSDMSLSRQRDELSRTFDVRWLTVPLEDRTPFDEVVTLVRSAIERTNSSRGVYVVGESFGGVLALSVALGSTGRAPSNLKGLVLINPATAVGKAWPSTLPPLLSALQALPDGISDAAYLALATPILTWMVGDPIRLNTRPEDEELLPPLRLAATLSRMTEQLPQLLQLGSQLPLRTLAFRLPQLIDAAKRTNELPLRKLSLPVDIIASAEDRVLPSVEEAKRLARRLPNANVIQLEGSGHVPLFEGQVSLSEIIRKSALLSRNALRPRDYVAEWTPPSEAELENATKSLANIRKLTSPVFLSTDATGRRVRGLGALPPLGTNPAVKAAADKKQGGHAEGPVLLIGNHQLYGATDIPLVVEQVYQETGTWVRALAHPVAFNSRPDLGPNSNAGTPPRSQFGGAVDFETFGAVPVNPRALFKLMQRGEPTLLYPGGVREAFKSTKKGEKYKLFWPAADESADFARVAARFNATIIPVAAVGAEEGFEMVLDADEALALPYFGQQLQNSAKNTPTGRPGERFVPPVSVPKLPGRYYFLFGAPISTAAVDPNDREACAALYSSVQAALESAIEYLLEKRKSDPYEPLLPRVAAEASWDFERQAPTFSL
ncbi:hypothetical protein AB1Y20_011411 [Prymnesium parvum]|uniref:AB hydrolase-1 domain-containing protein n=1 Tax=Prymnesium parvum TaxID=97485 RepID=A0AB34INU3_PRYPA